MQPVLRACHLSMPKVLSGAARRTVSQFEIRDRLRCVSLTFVAYTDESGDDGRVDGRSTPYFIEGGFLLETRLVPELDRGVREIIDHFYPGEEKRSKTSIRNTLAKEDRRARRHAVSYLLSLISTLHSYDAAAIGALFVKSADRTGDSSRSLRKRATQAMLGRVQSYAARRDAEFKLIHDRKHDHTSDLFLTKVATQWKSRQSDCRLTEFELASSVRTPLIQAADHLIGPALFTICNSCVSWPWQPSGRSVPRDVCELLHHAIDLLVVREGGRASVEIHDRRIGTRNPLPPPFTVAAA